MSNGESPRDYFPGDFILVTIAKYGETQVRRHASAALVEQAWQLAEQEKRSRFRLIQAQYRIDEQGKLSPMRFIFPNDHRKARSLLRRIAVIEKGFPPRA
jgi:hypothetical protein